MRLPISVQACTEQERMLHPQLYSKKMQIITFLKSISELVLVVKAGEGEASTGEMEFGHLLT